MIYSPACLLADQSRVWVARSIEPAVEALLQHRAGMPAPSFWGSSAVVVAGRHARCYAHDLEKTT